MSNYVLDEDIVILSKVINIGDEEINKLKKMISRFDGKELDNYKEEEYKEVYIKRGVIFVYDIYKKGWNYDVLYKPNCLIPDGFYRYKELENMINKRITLNKDMIYINVDKTKFKNLNDMIKRFMKRIEEYYVYNKELEVWEEINIDNAKRRIALDMFYANASITKEELDKIILAKELIS